MKCPFCKEEMKTGTISQDRYALKWVPEESDKGLLNFTPFIKGIKLTSMSNLTVKVFIVKTAENLSLMKITCINMTKPGKVAWFFISLKVLLFLKLSSQQNL